MEVVWLLGYPGNTGYTEAEELLPQELWHYWGFF